MSRGRHATPVKLAKKERAELLSLIERKTAAQRDVMRARIALWAHEGRSNTMIARELGVQRRRLAGGASASPSKVRRAYARVSAAAARHGSRRKRVCS